MELEATTIKSDYKSNKQKKEKFYPKFSASKFSVIQLSDLFGVSRPTIYDLIKEGVITPIEVSKKGIDVTSFGWDSILSLSNYYSNRIKKPKNKKIKVFANLKGGVGKSTIAAQFAMRVSAQGLKTLVIDLDPQAHATKILHFEDHEIMDLQTFRDVITGDGNSAIQDVIVPITPLLHLIPSNLSLSVLEMELFPKANREQKIIKPIKSLRDQYDVIIIDTNPSPSTVNISAILAADELCIVTETDQLSTQGLSSIFQVLRQIEDDFEYAPSARIIANKFDVRESMAQKAIGFLRGNFGDILVKTVVGKNIDIKESQSYHYSVWQYKRSSPGSEDIIALTNDLLTEEG
jgi:chromosome partitioning protein